jgi:hypothetical protein
VALPAWLGDGRAAWLDEVEEWTAAVVASAEVGPVVALASVREAPWGAVLRVVTEEGPLYFKASGPLGRHEPTIVTDLATRWPTLVPDIVAVDHERSWMLLADHGVPMRDALGVPEQVAVLERLLPTYAEMQASTSGNVARWLAIGTPDRRVGRLPELLDQLLRGSSPIGRLKVDDADRAAYLADLPRLVDACAELASTPVADALDHADLHGTNVLVDGARERLADWGDSCITHPFSSLLVPYTLVVPALPVSDRRPATLRLRDVYLEPWGSTPANRRAFGLAVWVGHVTRAVNVAYETLGESSDHDEIATLLRAWGARRTLLDRPDDVIQP